MLLRSSTPCKIISWWPMQVIFNNLKSSEERWSKRFPVIFFATNKCIYGCNISSSPEIKNESKKTYSL